MLTFFRRIRKRLLVGGHASKYLLYAVGEIALVVIGILIALQINNWNEGRKDKNIRESYINNLLEDLAADALNIDEKFDWCDRGFKKINRYFNYFDSVSHYVSTQTLIDSASIANHCCIRYFPVNNTFLEMQSSGNLKLLSETQRDALIGLYHAQEFTQIVIEKSISIWIEKDLKVDDYLPSRDVDLAFFQDLKIVSQQDLNKGLFHIHHKLRRNFRLLNYFKNRGIYLKKEIKKIISILENES